MKPFGREQFFDDLKHLEYQVNKSNISIITIIKGNPGIGKTYTVNLAFPKSFYINCKISLDFPPTIRSKVVILDEVDQFINTNQSQFLQFVNKLMNRKTKSLIILICNDITNKLNQFLKFPIAKVFDIQDYTDEQLKVILQQQSGQECSTGMNILIKKMLQNNRGDCRVLNNKLHKVQQDFSIKNILEIDNLSNLNLEYLEAYCVKALQDLKDTIPCQVLKIKKQICVGYDLDQIINKIESYDVEIQDTLIVQQFLEKLQVKTLIKENNKLYDLNVANLQAHIKKHIQDLTL
ncbi:hypothetical protein SS50377_23711 [Spironucleus salmonicida]|uniref:Uncharacterized protein n=1 Tax=Spironucleus salmonicida TaxID=348837 RepID=V6LWU1_9EUKA|nr:hypothetical protein SS50377_23711 [Spironucleus salmonicida]|eukprot:EST48693.1 Hypothetical protein SS50377_11306 [Spironucleus salmonicida]